MNSKKNSFTLLEIVVVLFIMGFIYTIGISSFSKKTIQEESYHFDLKSFLQDSLKTYDKKIELIVFDDFSLVRVDDNKATDKKITLPKEIEFFAFWQDGYQKNYFKPYFDGDRFKEVLFRYVVYLNKTATKCIIKKDEKYHIQSNYFRDKSVFEQLNDAQEYLQNSDLKNSSRVVDE